MRCVVLGGTGFLGGHLVNALRDEGHDVRVVARGGEPARALDGCEVLFHLIGGSCPESSNRDPARDLDANLVATVRLLDLACQHGVRKVVFPSSGGTVYGVAERAPISERHPTEPVCAYAVHKLAIEKYLRLYSRLHGLDYCVLRLANAYGEGQRPDRSQGVVAAFLAKAVAGAPIAIWGDGSVVRDYVHVDDISRAFCLAAATPSDVKVFNIGTGRGRSVEDVVTAIEIALGRPVTRRYLAARACDVPINVLDASLAAAHLQWTPRVSFADGVCRTLAPMRFAEPARGIARDVPVEGESGYVRATMTF